MDRYRRKWRRRRRGRRRKRRRGNIFCNYTPIIKFLKSWINKEDIRLKKTRLEERARNQQGNSTWNNCKRKKKSKEEKVWLKMKDWENDDKGIKNNDNDHINHKNDGFKSGGKCKKTNTVTAKCNRTQYTTRNTIQYNTIQYNTI